MVSRDVLAQTGSNSQPSSEPFLLNPKHADFLRGDERRFYDFRSRDGVGLVLLFLVFGIIGGVMIYAGEAEIVLRSQLAQIGVETSATVTALEETNSPYSDGLDYFLTYEFYGSQGSAAGNYTHRQQIDSKSFSSLTTGTHILIRYPSDDPTLSRYLSDRLDDGTMMAGIGAIFLACAVIMVYFIIRQYSRNQLLIRSGHLIAGKIVEISAKKSSSYTITVRYAFRTPEGIELSRSERRIRNDLRDAELPNIGTPVAVMYVHDKLYRIL